MTGELEGYGALVTGGGTGIGHACAAALASDGAAVMICGRTEAKLADSAERANQLAAHGGSVNYRVADVTDEDAVAGLVASALEPTGTLDAVVANAGGGGGLGRYDHQDAAEFRRVLELNVVGTMLCVKHSAPELIASGRGSFIGMSSIAGDLTHPYFGAYTAGKAGIEAVVRNAADEFGHAKVRFNAIRPGFIATEIMEGIPRGGSVYESYIENTPLGDVGQPEDVASLARFLAGPESRWITGQVIAVDGGHSLRRGPDFSEFVPDVQ
jgi:7-alpha-hydroxysteroid dehydrogenase